VGGSAGSAGSAGGGAGTAGAVANDARPAGDLPVRTGSNLPPGTPAGLPMTVTDLFENRGWFADPTVEDFFGSSQVVIEEAADGRGPCAARPPAARGKCLRFTYRPPAGLVPPPQGGFVGVFFLRTLGFYHPEVAPTPRPGSANWGLEPAIALAPGATRISFQAAAETPGLTVNFRAGLDQDAFYLPDLTATLGTSWQAYSIPLANVSYGNNLFGPFAWMLSDTTRPATFYLDNVVWEGSAPPPSVPSVAPPPPPRPPAVPAPTPPPVLQVPPGQADGVRQFVFFNRCTQPGWVGSVGSPGAGGAAPYPSPEGGGFRMDPGSTRTVVVPGGMWVGRFFGRTGCRFDSTGVGSCDTGSCGRGEKCGSATGQPPATLVEFTTGAAGGQDFYDLSLVDGYNLPMAVAPLPGTFTRSGGGTFDCGTAICSRDLNLDCPPELQFKDRGGRVVACLSACERFRTEAFCCSGAHNTPATCPPFDYSRLFKAACPTAYSYAYDDATSTYTCRGEDYGIWFCP
jgi:hypothetical protein